MRDLTSITASIARLDDNTVAMGVEMDKNRELAFPIWLGFRAGYKVWRQEMLYPFQTSLSKHYPFKDLGQTSGKASSLLRGSDKGSSTAAATPQLQGGCWPGLFGIMFWELPLG